jgi:hypothetical protein
MDDGLIFTILGATMGLSTLALAWARTRGATGSALPLAGHTPGGHAWTLDPDRRDAHATWWRLAVATPWPTPIRALPLDGPVQDSVGVPARFGRPGIPEPMGDGGLRARWRTVGEQAEGALPWAALSDWPADLPPPLVSWGRDLEIYAALPPDDARVGDLLALGARLADAERP